MREGHGALIWRAAAALGASMALHAAVVLVSGPLPLGALLGVGPIDRDPLFVEMVAGEASPGRPARPFRVSSVRPTRAPAPVAAGPVSASPTNPAGRPGATSTADAASGFDLTAPGGPSDTALLPSGDTTVAGPTVDAAPVQRADADAGSPPVPAPAPDSESAAVVPGGQEALAASGQTREEPLSATGQAREDATSVSAQVRDEASATGAQVRDEGASANGKAGEDGRPTEAVGVASQPAMAPDPRMDLSRLEAVSRNPSVSARAAGAPFVGRREVFEFLLDHPEFATHVARALRVARYRIWRTEDGLFLDDGWGATGQMFVVRASSGTRVLYARGEFQNKFLPVITGEAVVTITYEAQPAGDGRDLLMADVASQLRIDGPFGDLVARLANGMAIEKAEKESRRLVNIFARVLRAVDEKPAALYASLRERPDVPQRELEQFRVLLKLP